MDTTADELPGERSGRHPLNIGHLVMGLAFLGIVAVWGLVQGDAVTGPDVRWLLPLPWVLAGAAGLLALTLGGRRGRAGNAAGRLGTDQFQSDPFKTDPTAPFPTTHDPKDNA